MVVPVRKMKRWGNVCRCSLLVVVFVLNTIFLSHAETLSDAQAESLLHEIFEPAEAPSIQIQALRRDIIGRLLDALDPPPSSTSSSDSDEDNDAYQAYDPRLIDYDFKRSMASLARWGNLPPKRNIQSLMRGSGYAGGKRSIANMAKNGQLPHYSGTVGQDEPHKRYSNEELEELLTELYEKRNMASLARGLSYGKRYVGSLARANNVYRFENGLGVGKRNIASLARDGLVGGKRNVAALLRQDSYENAMHSQEMDGGDAQKDDGANQRSARQDKGGKRQPVELKRTLASVKSHYAGKREVKQQEPAQQAQRIRRSVDFYDGEASDEYASPVMQNQNVFDYEEMMRALTGEYPDTEKRFLGRLPQMGLPKTTTSPKTRYQ